MACFIDVAFTSETLEEVEKFRCRLRKAKRLENISDMKDMSGEKLFVGPLQKKCLVNWDVKIEEEFYYYIVKKTMYYFIASFFCSCNNLELWEAVSNLKCYFKIRDTINGVYINTDVNRIFFKERFVIYLSDDGNYLSNDPVLIEHDFETEKDAVEYINRRSKKHHFVSLRQIRLTSKRLGKDILCYEEYHYRKKHI